MNELNKLHYEIEIACSPKRVHELMLAKDTYKEWTHVFSPGSTYVGNWEEGSRIIFTSENENVGMYGRIEKNDPGKYVSIEHLGEWKDGKEVPPSEEFLNWVGAHENYTFEEKGNGTLLKVDLDAPEDFSGHFDGVWPKALDKLKEICERH